MSSFIGLKLRTKDNTQFKKKLAAVSDTYSQTDTLF